ncbi:precorrin-3B C(17)-methyltransferase [Candidatus Synechococcus spongiarum]|uniref:Precorrin-3B C(17)-methyltransferase n=1 Tax=Candidatus Synechococcus spongiarum LMB bulk15N TaxID=1943583 RepID=A0A1T1CRY5_9SYNE|nr:precorrin-3B C(17)-methyltransferase [Candidatus Synechococcus spongiarum]OOV31208.1 precorrin-3B C(17)-methyltransferase [Candidatus Synechococcus spongiarum LMB bulk15N]
MPSSRLTQARLGVAVHQHGLEPLLDLQAGGFLDEVAAPATLATATTGLGVTGFSRGLAHFLATRWPQLQLLVAAMASGALIRSLAPLLRNKHRDPAVLLLDGSGCHLIPLLGSHGRHGDQLAMAMAAYRGGQVWRSGYSSGSGQLAPDCFGSSLGWQRGLGNWDGLAKAFAQRQNMALVQESGSTSWRATAAAARLQPAAGPLPPGEPWLYVGHRSATGATAHWHPPVLWLGLGCERHTRQAVLEAVVEESLASAGLAAAAVAGVASLDRKGNEAGLLELCQHHQWPLKVFTAAQLAAIPVPNGSLIVARQVGTPSVAEAAALAAAGTSAQLLVPKTVVRGERASGAATCAVALATNPWAPGRGALDLVGSGPGALDQLTPAARSALAAATTWVGYGPYLNRLEPLRFPHQLRLDGVLGKEQERCATALALACQGQRVALVSSGDSGIYGLAGPALACWLDLPEQERPDFAVHPGISALQMAAARLGGPLMHDFCVISLSDKLTPWATIRQRLQAAALGDFVVALYNPRSKERVRQLQEARRILLAERSGSTPVAICRQLARPEERITLTTLAALESNMVDMLTLVLVGNRQTRRQDSWLLTPRGYGMDRTVKSG